VELGRHYLRKELEPKPDGSCVMVVATDAPLSARNLKRLAKRSLLGLARTGGIEANGSGDYVIAFSTARKVTAGPGLTATEEDVRNDAMSPLFLAVVEATEEAILDSLTTATATSGRQGRTAPALPLDQVAVLLKRFGRGK